MSNGPSVTKRAREEDGREGDHEAQPAAAKRRVLDTSATSVPADQDGPEMNDERAAGDDDQFAMLASRVNVLEDMLVQLRSAGAQPQDSRPPKPPNPASPLVIEIDASLQPPPLPDWASRARRGRNDRNRPDPLSSPLPAPLPAPQQDDSHEMLEMTIRNLEKNFNSEQLSLPHDDDDLLIRGIRNGWDTVARSHQLDTVWRFLRMFDLYLYELMSPISKLAALRALRTMLVHRIQPCNQALRPIPYFFEPTELQKTEKHSSLIDYFAWPSVRDHLIRHSRDIRGIPRMAQTKFAQNFVFDWPYEFEDAYMTVKASGRFVFSEDFNRRWNDLRYWTIRAFDDTNFIPTHLQLDKRQLTQCGSGWPSQARGVENRFTEQTDVSDVCATDSDSQSKSMPSSSQDSRAGNDAHASADLQDMSRSLDEWSWFFTDTRGTYETIRSLFEMSVPS